MGTKKRQGREAKPPTLGACGLERPSAPNLSPLLCALFCQVTSKRFVKRFKLQAHARWIGEIVNGAVSCSGELIARSRDKRTVGQTIRHGGLIGNEDAETRSKDRNGRTVLPGGNYVKRGRERADAGKGGADSVLSRCFSRRELDA